MFVLKRSLYYQGKTGQLPCREDTTTPNPPIFLFSAKALNLFKLLLPILYYASFQLRYRVKDYDRHESLLERLSNAHGVSGYEGNIRQIIEKEVRPYVDEIKTDKMGNLIATKPEGHL